jgi:hypothetical protein
MFTLVTKNPNTGRWIKAGYQHRSFGAVWARMLKETRFGGGSEFWLKTPEGKLYKAGA